MKGRDSLTGLILAGGQGRRMQRAGHGGKVEKGLLVLNGLPLVEHARRYLGRHADTILISANTRLNDFESYGAVVPDEPQLGAYSGPLAGVVSALARSTTPWMVVLPVDVTGLPEDLVVRLLAAVSDDGAHIAYARTQNSVHPLCMVLHRASRQSLYEFLLAGERKVQAWQRQNDAAAVLFDDTEHAFFNINTPQDLLRAGGSLRD